MSKRTPVIVCGGSSGRSVVFGYVDKIPEVDEPVTIYNARMVLLWSAKCGGLFSLAKNGPSADSGDIRLTSAVDFTKDTMRQILSVPEDAAKRFDEWPDFEG